MTDETSTPEPKTQLDTIGWLFVAAVAISGFVVCLLTAPSVCEGPFSFALCVAQEETGFGGPKSRDVANKCGPEPGCRRTGRIRGQTGWLGTKITGMLNPRIKLPLGFAWI